MVRWAAASKQNGGSSYEDSPALAAILSRTTDAATVELAPGKGLRAVMARKW